MDDDAYCGLEASVNDKIMNDLSEVLRHSSLEKNKENNRNVRNYGLTNAEAYKLSGLS
jgi:hypothetical protein